MSKPAGDISMIFVVGCPRSGTTLVSKLLSAAPDVFDAGESGLFYGIKNALIPSLANLPSAVMEPFVDQVYELARDVLVGEARKARARVVLEHTPWHVLCLSEIAHACAGAAFVHVLRDGRAVCASLKRSFQAGYTWAGTDVAARAALWKHSLDAAGRFRKNGGNLVEIKYEELLAKPNESLRLLCNALNLKFSEQMLAAFTVLHAGSTSKRLPIGFVSNKGIEFNCAGESWDANEWTEDELQAFELVAGKHNRMLGYDN